MMMNAPIKTKNDSGCKCFCLNNLHVDCFRISRANTNARFSRLYSASIRLFLLYTKYLHVVSIKTLSKINRKKSLDRKVDDLKHSNSCD